MINHKRITLYKKDGDKVQAMIVREGLIHKYLIRGFVFDKSGEQPEQPEQPETVSRRGRPRKEDSQE